MALWLLSFYISAIFAMCSMIHHLNYKKLVITALGKCVIKKSLVSLFVIHCNCNGKNSVLTRKFNNVII